jgi:hypothetical protein
MKTMATFFSCESCSLSGACLNLIDTMGIVRMIFGRCSKLRSLDMWRAYQMKKASFLSIIQSNVDLHNEEIHYSSLSIYDQEDLTLVYTLIHMPTSIPSLQHMTYLEEIDFGWTDLPGGFIKILVEQAGRCLIKIFLTACRGKSVLCSSDMFVVDLDLGINNDDMMAISQHCLRLRQLDILGSNLIVELSIQSILERCPKIEFLDLSFCSHISDQAIKTWQTQYVCSFKRSYAPRNHDDITIEYP